jgi:hypothetical protein
MTDLDLDGLRESAGSAGTTVKLGGSAESISYSWTPESDPEISDAVFAACLLPAMASASSLRVAGAVSPRLLSSAERIQEIFHNWAPHKLHPISIEAEPRVPSAPEPGAQVACFFSAGVDSFYSTLKHHGEIDALIFVHGFDVGLSDEILRKRVTTGVRNAAAELGKPLVEVETDLRAFSNQHVHWELFHGAALASVALLLQKSFRRIYVPSTLPYRRLIPWGSHPLVDPLWSTESVHLVHDGAEASRFQKTARVSSSEAALHWLRVCWRNPDSAYNCGRCSKCMRTMAELEGLGALSRSKTFPPKINRRHLRHVNVPRTLIDRALWNDSIADLGELGADTGLLRAMKRAAGPHPVRALRHLAGRVKRRITSR